jgi:Ni/Co efflux regulator RcnB
VLIKEIAMKTFKSSVSKSTSCLNRSLVGAMFGALVAGSVIVTPALAQPGDHHGASQNARRGLPQGGPQADRDYSDRGHRNASRQAVPQRYDARPRYAPPAPVRYQAPVRYHAPARHAVPYHFRAADRAYLQRHYQSSLRTVRVDRRPYFAPGQVIPQAYRSHVAVLPPHLRHRLPPPPRGYQVGYYQGYSVVYDPLTFGVLSVLDLLTR